MSLKRGPNSLDVGTAPIIEGSSPKHQVTAFSYLDFAKRIDLDLTFRYVSGLPELMVPAYSTADARFAWQATRHFQFSVVGQNLFQPYHFEFSGDPGPLVGIKRTVYGQIAWKR